MQVKVQVYAILRQYIPGAYQGPLILEVPEGTTVGQLIERLPIPRELARVVFVNGIRQEPDWVLREGDEVGIFPPIAGGAPEPGVKDAAAPTPILDRAKGLVLE